MIEFPSASVQFMDPGVGFSKCPIGYVNAIALDNRAQILDTFRYLLTTELRRVHLAPDALIALTEERDQRKSCLLVLHDDDRIIHEAGIVQAQLIHRPMVDLVVV